MTAGPSAPSEALRAGRRALDAVGGCEILEDLTWSAKHSVWLLRVRLIAEVAVHPLVPQTTDWVAHLDPEYPLGPIRLHPASSGGIESTFEHQQPNLTQRDGSAWRTGHICVDNGVRALGRHGFDDEPRTDTARLRWHVRRAQDWLVAASRDDLVRAGEPFELPAYVPLAAGVVGFIEDCGSLEEWAGSESRWGFASVARLREKPDVFAVRRFRAPRGRLIREARWGRAIASPGVPEHTAVWIRLDNAPVLKPYHAPTTYAELRAALNEQGVNFDLVLARASEQIRDGASHLLLFGFPIPELVGETPRQMHWQALMLPPLARGNATRPGFRPGPQGWAMHDGGGALAAHAPVRWIATENWSKHEISIRGRFDASLSHHRALVVGAGAIGSVLSEILIRGSAPELTIIDGECLGAGNLVRHTLSMQHVGVMKARSLASRLNQVSPHGRVVAIESSFPPRHGEDLTLVRSSGIVLDCTGDDDVLSRLASFEWGGDRLFVSVSLGLHAERLFIMVAHGSRFPKDTFIEAIEPWLLKEHDALQAHGLPREGLGCWHPVTPARIDHVWTMAGLAADEINAAAVQRPSHPTLIVYERSPDGIRRSSREFV